MTGEEIIRFYNRLVALMVEGRFRPSYGRKGGFLRFTPQKMAEAEEFSVWCSERSFHPPMYLCGAFGSHNWCYQPKWDRLREQRYVMAYDGVAPQWWELVERALDTKKPEPVTLPAQEMAKRRYRYEGKVAVCQMDAVVTGGFNSRSEVCQSCELREECRRG